jgi:hypothetical protein
MVPALGLVWRCPQYLVFGARRRNITCATVATVCFMIDMIEQAVIRLSALQKWPPAEFFRAYSLAMRGGKVEHLEWSEEDAKFDRFFLTVHEAGHAVVSYALGHGCSRISLSTHTLEHQGCTAFTWDGVFFPRTPKSLKPNAVAWAVANGIATAAGPAAELAIRLHCDRPVNPVQGNRRNSRDDALITEISGAFSAAPRGDSAYREGVWRKAQEAIANPKIMTAIIAVAAELNENYWHAPSECLGTRTNTMPGATARAIMRKEGIIPGMLTPPQLIETETRAAA